MPLLIVDKLSLSLRRRKLFTHEKREILREISFSAEEGETIGLIGESGSGKSTIGRCVTGLIEPTAGRIIFSGLELYPDQRNRRLVGSSIQLLFQNHTASLDPRMTIRRSLLEGIRDNGSVDSENVARRLLERVELSEDLLDRFPGQLSGGQRQRVALARALSTGPRLLILDEPTSALDVVTELHIIATIKRIQRETGVAVIFISHDVAAVRMVCNHLVVLRGGMLVESGRASDIMGNTKHDYTRTLLSPSRPRISIAVSSSSDTYS